MRKLLPLLGLSLLAGCVYPPPQLVQSLNGSVGMSESDLIRGYGVPSRSTMADGHKFVAYTRHYSDIIGGDPGFGFGYGYGYGYPWGWGGGFGGWGGGFPPEIVHHDCDITFEIDNARVTSWKLRGDGCGPQVP